MIRRLGPADAAAFADIRLEGLRLAPDSFGSEFEIERAWPLAKFAERLTSSTVFGFEDAGDLLGVAGFVAQSQRKFRHRGDLWGMYVRESARGRGVGARLVEAVIDHARDRVKQLHLHVATTNRAAAALYQKYGFRRYGVEPRAMKASDNAVGEYMNAALMVRFLDDADDAPEHAATLFREAGLE